ncbi:alpha-N-acetylglucosaminidase [Prolixibacteraceae bacterium]|nr:alpha-N-acetylglucosaminidase [Prolixibacteraceae bacterium]
MNNNRTYILWLIIGMILLLQLTPKLATATPIKELTKRILKEKSSKIKYRLLRKETKDIFEIESNEQYIIISGNNTISQAVGLNYYLSNYCKTDISWFVDDEIHIPTSLPRVEGKIQKSAHVKNRFFLNYCTFGYSLTWWQWRDWEHLIDWMALNGITMPLAITGQEAIWYKVWRSFGLSDIEVRSYFTGPAHLPWHRMSNIDKWGGPLPKSWLDHQMILQKRILKRERALGMTPILPAFAGHVPQAISKQYTEAKITSLGNWGGFKANYHSYFLDPLDPLFSKVQQRFLKYQKKYFGTNHYYGIDPFNEVTPPSWEPEYLETVGKTIYSSLATSDPKAVWIQMTWMFYYDRHKWTNPRIKAMVRSVPQDKMILLDYFAEKKEVWRMTDRFFKQPYIWCYLGNFGGGTALTGDLQKMHDNYQKVIQEGGGNMIGIGSTLEGLDVNPVMYRYLFDLNWSRSLPLKEWITSWADLRYGSENTKYREAWSILSSKIYNNVATFGQSPLINGRPKLKGRLKWVNHLLSYNNRDLFKVWELMLQAGDTPVASYHYDITNIGRQVLGNHFTTLRNAFAEAYQQENVSRMEQIGEQMTTLISDIDRLVQTQSYFLVGKWLEDAKKIGIDQKERDYYEENARNIITTWGEKNQSLNDYANRTWSGLTSDLYLKRWELFITEAIKAKKEHLDLDQKMIHFQIVALDDQWVKGHQIYPSKPKGNSYLIAMELFRKYATMIRKEK